MQSIQQPTFASAGYSLAPIQGDWPSHYGGFTAAQQALSTCATDVQRVTAGQTGHEMGQTARDTQPTIDDLVTKFLDDVKPYEGRYEYITVPGIFTQPQKGEGGSFWDIKGEISDAGFGMAHSHEDTRTMMSDLRKVLHDTLGMKTSTEILVRHGTTRHNVITEDQIPLKAYELHQLGAPPDTLLSDKSTMPPGTTMQDGLTECSKLWLVLRDFMRNSQSRPWLSLVTQARQNLLTEMFAAQCVEPRVVVDSLGAQSTGQGIEPAAHNDTSMDELRTSGGARLYKPAVVIMVCHTITGLEPSADRQEKTERSAFSPTDKTTDTSILKHRFRLLIFPDDAPETDQVWQDLPTRQKLFEALSKRGKYNLRESDYLGEDVTKEVRQLLINRQNGAEHEIENINNLVLGQILRETVDGWNGESSKGELNNRSRRGDVRIFDVLWSLPAEDTETFVRVTHGQVSEVELKDRLAHHAETLSEDDWAKLRIAMEAKPSLRPTLHAMTAQRQAGYDPGEERKMLNAEARVHVYAYRPMENHEPDASTASLWKQAMSEWMRNSAMGSSS